MRTIGRSTFWSAGSDRSWATTRSVRHSSAPFAARDTHLSEAAVSDGAGFRQSVFAKLLATTLTTAISLLALVTVFFAFVMVPALNRSTEPIVDDYVRKAAATQPDFEEAKRLSRRFDLEVRYEGPDG